MTKNKIYDVITYNGEKDLFDIRYNILKDYVDEFIVIEFDKTFSGKDKHIDDRGYFDKYDNVRYVQVRGNVWHKYMNLAWQSPNTLGADHWKEEFCQKEYIKDCLLHLKDDDIVYLGDCDEIWNPEFSMLDDLPVKLCMKVYSYYLNNRSSENFNGTLRIKYKDLKDLIFNHARTEKSWYSPFDYGGWHFTSMGGHAEVERKLSDSYTRESYWTESVESNLKDNIEKSKDFLGRAFTYKIDESELPKYLIDNKEKYDTLFKK